MADFTTMDDLNPNKKSSHLNTSYAMKFLNEAGSGGSFKRGGKVKRTGYIKAHKGERVLTRKQAKRYAKKMKKR